MASEERRTKSTEELVKEIKSGVWGYGAERRGSIQSSADYRKRAHNKRRA